jgi:hypothetical protein
MTQLRYAEALVPVRHVRRSISLHRPDRDGKWAIRLGKTLKQEPPNWVGNEAREEQLGQEGDFVVGANLAYFGSRQLRMLEAKLRSAREEQKGGDSYLVTSHRPLKHGRSTRSYSRTLCELP